MITTSLLTQPPSLTLSPKKSPRPTSPTATPSSSAQTSTSPSPSASPSSQNSTPNQPSRPPTKTVPSRCTPSPPSTTLTGTTSTVTTANPLASRPASGQRMRSASLPTLLPMAAPLPTLRRLSWLRRSLCARLIDVRSVRLDGRQTLLRGLRLYKRALLFFFCFSLSVFKS